MTGRGRAVHGGKVCAQSSLVKLYVDHPIRLPDPATQALEFLFRRTIRKQMKDRSKRERRLLIPN